LFDPLIRSALASIAGGLLAVAGPWGAEAPAARDRFEVRVPQEWRKADRLILLIKGVSLPKDQPVVFQFYATAEDGEEIRLGSYGVVAESETARGRWNFEVLPIHVTRPLRRWLDARPRTRTVRIRVEPVDGSGRPIDDLDWTVRAMELKAIRNP
jgi:hypothetical protein